MPGKWLRTRVTITAAVLLAFIALPRDVSQAGENNVSGVWQGMVAWPESGDTPIKITVRRKDGSFSGVISIPSDGLNIPIDRGEYDTDEEYLLLSGVSKVAAPDGSTPRMRFMFEGFLDDGGRAWSGDWRIASLDDEEQPLAGDSFGLWKNGRAAGGGNAGETTNSAGRTKPSFGKTTTSKPPEGGISGQAGVPQGRIGGEDATLEKQWTYGSPNVEQELLDSNRLKIAGVSDDPEYGRSPEKPVMVGNGGDILAGPQYEQRFLNSLAGPNGEPLSWKRQKSGHSFSTTNSPLGEGVLDVYEVSHAGLGEPILLYINMYDSDRLSAPAGLTIRTAK